MKLTRDVMQEVLDEYAPPSISARELPDEYQRALRTLEDPLLRRALGWMAVLQQELFRRGPWWHAAALSAGFLYVSPEVRIDRRQRRAAEVPVFGVGVYDPPGPWRRVFPAGEEYIVVRVRGREVPIVLRQGVTELHQGPPQILGATTTCWASHSESRLAGILTARHVLAGRRVGDQVAFVDGQVGVLAGVGPELIDAAHVELRYQVDAASVQLALLELPAPGTPVKFTGNASGAVNATIAEVLVSRYRLDPWLPQRVMLDRPGAPGDSGALVRDVQSTSGVALYCGALPVGLSSPLGVCQLLTQAAGALNLTLYEP